MRFFLSELNRRRIDERASHSFLAEAEREGHVRLFNRNAGTTWHVPAVRCLNYHGWILECDEVPDYFKNVLKPVTDDGLVSS